MVLNAPACILCHQPQFAKFKESGNVNMHFQLTKSLKRQSAVEKGSHLLKICQSGGISKAVTTCFSLVGRIPYI